MMIVIVILVVVLDCYDEIMVKWSKKVVVVAVAMVVVGGYGGELLYNDIIKCGYINDKMIYDCSGVWWKLQVNSARQ